MPTISTIKVELAVDDRGFRDGLKKAEQRQEQFARESQRSGQEAAQALTTAFDTKTRAVVDQGAKRYTQAATTVGRSWTSALTNASATVKTSWTNAGNAVGSATRSMVADAKEATKALNETADAAGGAGGGRGAGGGGLAGALGSVASAATLLTGPAKIVFSVLEVGSKVVGGIASGLGAMAGAAMDAARAIGGVLWDAASKVFGFMAGAGVAGVAALGAGLTMIGKTGVDMNITLEGSRVALTRMTGSAGAAAKLIKDLREEAKYSQLTFKEMLPTAQSLVGVLGPGGVGKVVPIMRAFGDAAVALRVGSQGVDQALYGFRQLLGRPTVQQEEISQIDEALPGANIRGILRNAFGTADTEVLQKAGVTGQQAGEAIIAGLQSAFGGSQRAGSGSLPMIQSGIMDTLNDLSGSVTEGLTARLTKAGQGVSDFLNNLNQTAGGQSILKALTEAFNAVGDGAVYLANQLPALANALKPILDSIPWDQWRTVAVNAFELVRDAVSGAGGWVKDNWGKIWDGAKAVTLEAVGVIGGTIAGLAAVWQDWTKGGAQDLKGLFGTLREFAANSISFFGKLTAVVLGLAAALAKASANHLRMVGMFGQANDVDRGADAMFRAAWEAPGISDRFAASVRSGNLGPLGEGLDQRRDSIGTFMRGFNGFRESVRRDGFNAIPGVREASAALTRPNAAAMGTSPGIGGYVTPTATLVADAQARQAYGMALPAAPSLYNPSLTPASVVPPVAAQAAQRYGGTTVYQVIVTGETPEERRKSVKRQMDQLSKVM